MTDTALAIVERPEAPALPGSKPLRNHRHEMFARLRSQLRPKSDAYRRAFETADDYEEHAARGNASKVERRKDVADRIAFLSRQDEDLLTAKRARLEEMLWLIHEANVADLWEVVEVEKRDKKGNLVAGPEGKPVMVRRQQMKFLSELPEEVQRTVESVTVDERGHFTAKVYSRLTANAELRKLLGIGAPVRGEDGELLRLSDSELVAQLAKQAQELGISIDLNYRFGDQ